MSAWLLSAIVNAIRHTETDKIERQNLMKEKDYLDLLEKREIQPTAIRILVLQAMLKAGRSVSLLDLENMHGYG